MTNEKGVKTDLLSFLTKHSKKITIFLVLFCMITIAAAGITYWQYKNAVDLAANEVPAFTEEQIQTAKLLETAAGKVVSISGEKVSVELNTGETKTYSISTATNFDKDGGQANGMATDLVIGKAITFSFDSGDLTILNISY